MKTKLLLFLGLCAALPLGYFWLRFRAEGEQRAIHDRSAERQLANEQELRRQFPDAAPGPITTMIDLETAFVEENPGHVMRDPKHDATFDTWAGETPPRGELDYKMPDGREARLCFRWAEDHWQFQSQAIRAESFFHSELNEPGSERKEPPFAIRDFLDAHGVTFAEASPAPLAAAVVPPPPRRTPTPQEIAQTQAARARAEAAEIARKYAR